MARHPRPPSPSPPRAPSDSDAGFDPIEEWLVDFDQAMANELAKSFGLGEEAAAPSSPEPTSCEGGKVSEDGSVSESRGSNVKEEVVEKDGLLCQFGTSCGGEFDVKESETVSGVLGGQLGPDQVPLSGIGDLAAKEDISEGVVDSEMSTIASDAEMNTAVSVKEEVVGGGGKEETSEDEEEGEESSEASSSSEEEGEEQRAKKDEESSEASSSSDEEEERTKIHGGGVDMEALLEEGELMIGSEEEEEEEEEEAPKGRIKSKHEVEVLPPVPKIEVQLESHHKTLPVGTISAIMGERVIVEGSVQHSPLDEGSILWITESRTPLGIVDELFGPVKNPYYLIRYNSAEEVPAGISAGTAVSFVTEFADHILNMKELYSKGYDASGDNDADQTDELGFSDDEKEAEYKRSLRLAKRQTDTQHESKKPSGDKKRAQPRGAGFQKDMPPRIRDAPTGHQSQPHFHRSDTSPVVADNRTHPLGPENLPMSVPTMLPPVPMSSTMPSAVQIANQMGGCFINPSQQFLPQQPNVIWPGGLPPTPHPNMGVEGAALAANIMQNILIGANQYQQQFQNQNFGGFLNQMPMPPPQFMPQSGMPANPMSFGGPPVNPPFVPAPPLPMGQGNFGQPPHMAREQGPPPGFPNGQRFGRLPTPPGDGEQPPAQFNSGHFNQGNSSLRGRRVQQRGGRHSSGRGGGRHSSGRGGGWHRK